MKNKTTFDDYSTRKGSFISQLLAAIRSPILSLYALFRKSFPVWDLINRRGKSLFKNNLPPLDSLQKKILGELNHNGVAISSLDELFPKMQVTENLIRAAMGKKEKPALNKDKPFLSYSMGKGSIIDLSNPLIQFSLNPRILQIVNSYLSLFARLTYFELATTNLVKNNDKPKGSQRWHRDPALHRLCKVFVYLTDVEEENGPFKYIEQSQTNGKFSKIFPQRQFGRHGFYPPNGEVEKKISQDKLRSCKGKKGTVIFCDTTGLHKGGYALVKKRIMYTSTYMSEGEIFKSNFIHPKDLSSRLENLDPASRFAVKNA